ncbi:hypothetical protein BURK1_02290 [Burkholderiales bacterium]|nr:hypothetical protein BURK1_02290 [Burkholderiales bacterium]
MKLEAWGLGIALLAGVSFAHGQNAMDHPPVAAETVAKSEAKSQDVYGFLEFSGSGSYAVNNGAGTVEMAFDRLDNQSMIYNSGSIRIMLFLTQFPIVPGQGFDYWILASDQLNPLPANFYYYDYFTTRPRQLVPDGVYYIYLGAFEYENSCGSTSGYCLDDYFTFQSQVQVIGGNVTTFGGGAATTTTAVEYYHAGFGHYFVTADADEINGIDGGAYGGAWQRTGQTFKVWTSGVVLFDVCRFFQVYFAPKSSHFYTAIDYECAGLILNSFVWQFEKIAFKVKLPSGGICPAGSIPLYRVYNNGMSGAPNHRYTTSLAIRNQMLALGFVPEDANTVCVPV